MVVLFFAMASCLTFASAAEITCRYDLHGHAPLFNPDKKAVHCGATVKCPMGETCLSAQFGDGKYAAYGCIKGGPTSAIMTTTQAEIRKGANKVFPGAGDAATFVACADKNNCNPCGEVEIPAGDVLTCKSGAKTKADPECATTTDQKCSKKTHSCLTGSYHGDWFAAYGCVHDTDLERYKTVVKAACMADTECNGSNPDGPKDGFTACKADLCNACNTATQGTTPSALLTLLALVAAAFFAGLRA